MQVQSIKQANSVLKRSLADGVDAVRPAEVQSVISTHLHQIFFYILTLLMFIMISLAV